MCPCKFLYGNLVSFCYSLGIYLRIELLSHMADKSVLLFEEHTCNFEVVTQNFPKRDKHTNKPILLNA